ncbi:MAG: hypothetical protein H6706_26105 [Myxococcales bacterium]|nr:hypothetical protein [Myxococcales bacterium]
MRGLVVVLLVGCGSGGGEAGAGGGAGPPCVWCADAPPHVRPCRATMIASGGQLVCVDDGEGRLCEPAARCGP